MFYMDFPLYFQKVIWKWRNLIWTKKNFWKGKTPDNIYPSIRIGGFRKWIFTFVHYHPRLSWRDNLWLELRRRSRCIAMGCLIGQLFFSTSALGRLHFMPRDSVSVFREEQSTERQKNSSVPWWKQNNDKS